MLDSCFRSLSALMISQPAKKTAPRISPPPSFFAEHVFFRIYDYILTLIPSTVNPNHITLFGILCTSLSSILLLFSMKWNTLFEPPYPSLFPTYSAVPEENPLGPLYPTVMDTPFFLPSALLLFLCGILNLIYCIADNTDGRVARRDSRTSSLGEYLDHSLDCITSLLSTGVLFCVCGASSSNMAVGLCSTALATSLVHIFHYETNVFVLGNRILSADEGMIFFGVGLWIPILVPSFAFLLVPIPEFLMVVFPSLKGFRLVDLLYTVLLLAQGWTIFGLICKRPTLPCRVTAVSLIVCCIVFLSCIPFHCSLASYFDSNTSSASIQDILFSFSFFRFGPFAYPALFIITAASTFSSIIHIPIYALCAKLPRENFNPLRTVFVSLLLFAWSPAFGMLWAVSMHIKQILRNTSNITLDSL